MTMREKQKKRSTLSLCMIVKNEEQYLSDCLASATPFVDEIIVIDTGSTDRTVDIAKAAGARLFHEEWRDDFAAARNRSLCHATGDWILVLDADERLSGDGGRIMRDRIEVPGVAAYLVRLQCPTHGGSALGTMSLKWLPRLFRNGVGARYEGIVHECLLPSLRGKGKIVHSEITLEHLGYLQSDEVMRVKAMRNLHLLEGQAARTPDDSLTWIQLAETYLTLSRHDQAIASYQKALTLLTHERDHGQRTISNATAAVAYQQLGALHLLRGGCDEAIVVLRQAIDLWPALASAYLYLGQAHENKGELENARESYGMAIEWAQRPEPPGHPVRLVPWLPWLLKGTVECKLQRYDAARDALDQAICLNPDFPGAHTMLGVIDRVLGRPHAALEAFETARRLGDATASLLINIGTTHHHLGNFDKAVQAFQEALVRESESRDARLGLCRAYVQLGQWSDVADEGYALLERGVVDPDLYRLVGQALRSLGMWTAAVSVYEALCAMTNPIPADWSGLAIVALGAGQPIKALQAAEYALSVNPPEDLRSILQAVTEQAQEALPLESALL